MSVTNQSWMEAQYSVLGSALLEPKVVPLIMAQTQESDFSGSCQTVYQTMAEIFRSGFPVDVVSVAARLPSEYRGFLAELMEVTPSAANVGAYINLCREQSRVLSCREIGFELSTCESAKDARALVEQAFKLITSAQENRTVSMEDALRRFYERIENPARYLTWPIQELEKELYVGPGNLIVLGAEPSAGKTAFALQAAWHWAKTKKVGFFSLETSPDVLFDRLISVLTGIPMEKIKTRRIDRRDLAMVEQTTQAIRQSKLKFISASGMTVSDIRAKVMEAGYKIIVIDYMQIVSAKGSNRYEEVTNISIDLHTLAQSLGVTVLALSQLSRSDGERTPKNSDLRESGQIEQDADLILMLQLTKQACPEGPRNLYVTKNKEGRLFQMILNFDGKHQTFSKGGALDAAVADAQAFKKKHKGGSLPPIQEGPITGQMDLLPTDTDVPFKD